MGQVGHGTPFGDNAYFDRTKAYLYVASKKFYSNKIHHMRYDIKPIKPDVEYYEGSNNVSVGGHWVDDDEYEVGDIVTYDGINSKKASYNDLPPELKEVYDSIEFKQTLEECRKNSLRESDWDLRSKVTSSAEYEKHMKTLDQVAKILKTPYRTDNCTAFTRDVFYMDNYEIITIRDTYEYYISMKGARTWVPCIAKDLIKQCKSFAKKGKYNEN